MQIATESPTIPQGPMNGAGVLARTSSHGLGAAAASRERQQSLHSRSAPSAGNEALGGVGLWIDHRKAVIVFVSLGGSHTTLVLSRIEKQPGRIAGQRSTAPFEPQLVPADNSRERRYSRQLDLYYDAVIACIRDKGPILAFGPGEAKGELRRRLALNKQDRRVFEFETTDKMTGRQIAAKTMEWIEGTRSETPTRRRSGRPER
jgi:hypothetical protein